MAAGLSDHVWSLEEIVLLSAFSQLALQGTHLYDFIFRVPRKRREATTSSSQRGH
jgi:hypothetical protein